jgi:hypothetical protein
MKNKCVLAVLAVAALGVSAQATPITINFQENGTGNLGSSSTFTQSGASLTAYASPSQNLYAKNSGGDEVGLGIASDPTGDHEIYGSTFIQLLSSTVSGFDVLSVSFGSTTDGEIGQIWYSPTLGTLGTFVGSVSSDTSFVIPIGDQNGYIGIASGTAAPGNVLLASATGTAVPDSSSTLMLLGGVLSGLGLIKRKLMA